MDGEGIVKAVDAIYKNILEKFNPESKRMLTTAKAYLKALHCSSQASKTFNDSLAKLAQNANESSNLHGSTSDIGNALTEIVGIFNAIEDQHLSILKAFYVDFICPLESNLEKDVKIIQIEQKRFNQNHKLRVESFNKATTAMKKHRKKKNNAERELKCIQVLEEEKKNLDMFCDQSFKNALTQERRRYGFVLERCTESIAKHYLHYFANCASTIENKIYRWSEVAKTREILPTGHENEELNTTIGRHDLSCKKMEQANNVPSDESDASSTENNKIDIVSSINGNINIPRFPAEIPSSKDEAFTVTALFSYSATAENQLNFLEGDKLYLIGEDANGWQFGENARTKNFGWFPSTYINYNNEKSNDQNDDMEETIKHRTITRQKKYQNPPRSRPPSPPSANDVNGRNANGKSSMRGIYSSNDSGFSNEVPPVAPEVDYSDDELPQKIPIRKPSNKNNTSTISMPKDIQKSVDSISKTQSTSFGDLTESSKYQFDSSYNNDAKTTKRNKAFWRFSKSEDILEGMGLWKHRDLLTTDGDDSTLKKSQNGFDAPIDSRHMSQVQDTQKSKPERSMRGMENESNDENIYDDSPKRRDHSGPMNLNLHSDEIQDTNFYDDDELLLKTVKRKEILKQYYSSETDTEISINSDPYDCIVVNDHLVKRGDFDLSMKPLSKPGELKHHTLLPRTKLSKSKKSPSERGSSHPRALSKSETTFEPWRDLWAEKSE